jgi:TonB family protein
MHDGSKAAGILPCSDAWSLGITLAEVLTQQRPSWQKEGQQDPALPKEIPGPFLDIIRNCLRSEPQQRWTIEQIAARLHPPSPAPAKAAPARQEIAAPTKKTPSRRWRYIVPSAAVAFAAVLVAGLGILNRQQPTPIQPQTQMREDPPIATTLPTADAEGAQKPSPATPLAGRGSDSQQPPKAVEASLPASPATGETRTTNGDTKTNGIVQQVLPDVPQKARDTIQGKVKVKVRVQVDASGDVTEAELDSPGPSKYFAQLALQAAQRWKFEPAQAGTDSSREWLLRFEFGSVEAKAFPSPAPRKVQ